MVTELYVFVDENDPEKGDNLVLSLHPIPVSTSLGFQLKKKERDFYQVIMLNSCHVQSVHGLGIFSVRTLTMLQLLRYSTAGRCKS